MFWAMFQIKLSRTLSLKLSGRRVLFYYQNILFEIIEFLGPISLLRRKMHPNKYIFLGRSSLYFLYFGSILRKTLLFLCYWCCHNWKIPSFNSMENATGRFSVTLWKYQTRWTAVFIFFQIMFSKKTFARQTAKGASVDIYVYICAEIFSWEEKLKGNS